MQSSRKLILLILLALILLSILATLWKTPQVKGKIPLLWNTDANPVRDEQVALFNSLHESYHAAIDVSNCDVMKIIVQCAAGMGPDLIDQVVYFASQSTFYDAGILMDLTDEAEANGFGLSTLHPKARPLVTVKGLDAQGNISDRQVCYPANYTAFYVFYNKNLFRQANLPFPKEDLTWDEYEKLAMALNKPDPDINKRIFGGAGVPIEKLFFDFDAHWFNAAGTVSQLNTEAVFNVLKKQHEMMYITKVEPTPVEFKSVSSAGGIGFNYISWFGEGRLGMLHSSRWALILLRRFIHEQELKRAAFLEKYPNAPAEEIPQVLEFGCVQVPRPAGKERFTPIFARSVGVNAATKHKDGAFAFMRFLASKEYADHLNEGADSNPGPLQFHNEEYFLSASRPGEEEAHRVAVSSIEFGKTIEISPFISPMMVARLLGKATDKIANSPEISDDEIRYLLKKAAEEVDREILRIIQNDPQKQTMYKKLLEQGAEPIRYHEELDL